MHEREPDRQTGDRGTASATQRAESLRASFPSTAAAGDAGEARAQREGKKGAPAPSRREGGTLRPRGGGGGGGGAKKERRHRPRAFAARPGGIESLARRPAAARRRGSRTGAPAADVPVHRTGLLFSSRRGGRARKAGSTNALGTGRRPAAARVRPSSKGGRHPREHRGPRGPTSGRASLDEPRTAVTAVGREKLDFRKRPRAILNERRRGNN